MTFVPETRGIHELRGKVPGRELWLLRSCKVAARPRRWFYAAILGPLGLLLIGYNLFVLRRIRRSQPDQYAS